MTDTTSFNSFILRVRAGDEESARELVRRFGGLIRREVRLRLFDRHLLRVFDSMDIAQSVFKSFFTRAVSGDFEIQTPEQLARLLIGMTRNKVAFQKRRHYARRRDSRLTEMTRVDEMEVVSASPGPSQVASDNDLFEAVVARLGEDERRILGLRVEGWEWAEIAARLGGSPQARRMQLARAVHRVSRVIKAGDRHA